MAFDITKLAQLGHIQDLGNRIKSELQKVTNKADDSIKRVGVSGNTISFFTETDPSYTTAAYTVDFPSEMVLDQANTTLVENFTYTTTAYAGAETNRVSGVTANDVIMFGTNGEPLDSGIGTDTIILTSMVASNTEANEMLQEIFPTVVAGGGE